MASIGRGRPSKAALSSQAAFAPPTPPPILLRENCGDRRCMIAYVYIQNY
jgi:hypothetical protein